MIATMSDLSTLYRFGDVTVASELDLPGMAVAPHAEAFDVGVHIAPPISFSDNGVSGSTTIEADGTCVVELWPMARIETNLHRRSIVVHPYAGTTDSLLRHAVVDHALPRWFALLGRPAFHATAVAVDGRAIAFMGASGRGKSTLAGSLVGQGGEWVADDLLLLDVNDVRTIAIPTVVSTRLLADSAAALGLDHDNAELITNNASKRRWTVSGSSDPVQLSYIFVLDRRADTQGPVVTTVLNARQAITELALHWFLSGTEAVAPLKFLMTSDRLLRTTRMLYLSYPNSYDRLGDTVAAIHTELAR